MISLELLLYNTGEISAINSSSTFFQCTVYWKLFFFDIIQPLHFPLTVLPIRLFHYSKAASSPMPVQFSPRTAQCNMKYFPQPNPTGIDHLSNLICSLCNLVNCHARVDLSNWSISSGLWLVDFLSSFLTPQFALDFQARHYNAPQRISGSCGIELNELGISHRQLHRSVSLEFPALKHNCMSNLYDFFRGWKFRQTCSR